MCIFVGWPKKLPYIEDLEDLEGSMCKVREVLHFDAKLGFGLYRP